MTKLHLAEPRVAVPVETARTTGCKLLETAGCPPLASQQIVDHLIDAEQCGVESHGVMRVLQYAGEMERGYLDPSAVPRITSAKPNVIHVDGGGGIGIRALDAATQAGISAARENAVVAIAVRNTGHTGRLGAFAEQAALAHCLFIACGGGARVRWRMVAPFGGARAVLPTNPWCLGIPGGEQGPVVLDCATGQIAGGWIYAAHRAGATLPEGAIVDRNGQPTTNPADYFDGGAILPKGGVLGYGLATMAELICDAMLGPAKVECNTFILMVDTAQFREAGPLQQAAEDILGELRACPPAAGYERVEICGEREQARRRMQRDLHLPARTWEAIRAAVPD
jgi:uncharacterized oxidoreductase